MPKVLKLYLDTSILNGYFDHRNLNRQRITREFWLKLSEYQVFISDIVIDEIKATGDKNRKQDLLKLVKTFEWGVSFMSYFSHFYGVEVRSSIAKEFTDSSGEVDDMMAGLHEIRARRAEKKYNLKDLARRVKETQSQTSVSTHAN